jgi:hypothetical protein
VRLLLASLINALKNTRYQLAAQLDPNNAGVLIVQLNGAQRGERGMGADEISRRLEKDDGQCIAM